MHLGRWQLAEIDALEAFSLSPPGFAISGYANSILARLDALKGNAESCRARALQTLRQSQVGDEGVSITFARVALADARADAWKPSARGRVLPREPGGRGAARTAKSADHEHAGRGHRDRCSRRRGTWRINTRSCSSLQRRRSTHPPCTPSPHTAAACSRAMTSIATHLMRRSRGTSGEGVDSTAHALSLRTANASDVTDTASSLGGYCARRSTAWRMVGSPPWAERGRRELQATGETTHPRVASSRDLLTPQELQVARLASEGLSNNEIAARLFLSPRTVEKHLTAAFRNYGVSSRRALIHAGAALLGD